MLAELARPKSFWGLEAPAEYYVSASAGNDNAGGTSQQFAWATLARASKRTYIPGDSLLLEAGVAHTGQFLPRGGGTFDDAAFDTAFASAHASGKAAALASAPGLQLVADAQTAGQTAPQAAAWADIWASQIALPAAQDTAWTAAQSGTLWVTVGRYGSGANPILDGGGSVASAIYFPMLTTQGAWRFRDLEIRNYTAGGIFYYPKSHTTVTDELYRGATNGFWAHDLNIHDVALAGLPDANPANNIPGYVSFVATGIVAFGVNYVRVEDTIFDDTDLPFYIGFGQYQRLEQITSPHSHWQHAELSAGYRVAMTNSSFLDQCNLGYHHGTAGFFSGHMNQYLCQGCTFSDTTRPISPINGLQAPDGVGYDLETRHKHAVFDQNTLENNCASAWELLNSYALGPVGGGSAENLWTRNIMNGNGFDNVVRSNVAIMFVQPNPAQGTALWWANVTDYVAPGVNRWIQQGSSVNVIPGTAAGTPWIYGADNTET